jgi:hypothetical protein
MLENRNRLPIVGRDVSVATALKKLQFLLQYIQQISAVTCHNNLLLPIFSLRELVPSGKCQLDRNNISVTSATHRCDNISLRSHFRQLADS